MRTLRKSQKGLVIPLALVMLSVGALVTVPFLDHVQTGINALSSEHAERYAADAGVEDAIWRLHTDYNGFADALTPENPSASHSIVVNGIDVYITVELPNFPEGGPDGGGDGDVQIKKVPEQPVIRPWQMSIVGFSIAIKNPSQTKSASFDQIKDELPMPFHYVQQSTTGITTSNPVVTWNAKNPVLTWDLAEAIVLAPGETRYLNFRAMVIPPPGLLYSSVFGSSQGVQVGASGPTGAVAVAVYEITSTAGRVTVEACLAVDLNEVTVISWQQVT